MSDANDRRSGAAWWIATFGGAGRAPIAPGTVGSALAVVVLAALAIPLGRWAAPLLAILATGVGIAAADRVSRDLGAKDPGCVVIDEVAGQAMALAFLPLTPATAIAGFVLFRLFDIIKPPPCRRLERLQGGLGIMADDLAAGVYANLTLRAATLLAPAAFGT